MRVEFGRKRSLTLHRPAGRIHQNLAKPWRAVQQTLISAFDAQFANQGGARVSRLVDMVKVLFADGSYVAQRMHCYWAKRIMARQTSMNIDAGEFVAMHREPCHLLVAEL